MGVTQVRVFVEKAPIISNRFEDIAMEIFAVQFIPRSKLPLSLSAGILSSLIVVAVAGLPWPFGEIISLALAPKRSLACLPTRRVMLWRLFGH